MPLSILAEAYLVAGRLEDAKRTAQEGLELARQLGERGHEADALRVLGGVATQRDPPDAAGAEDAYGQGLALAAELN